MMLLEWGNIVSKDYCPFNEAKQIKDMAWQTLIPRVHLEMLRIELEAKHLGSNEKHLFFTLALPFDSFLKRNVTRTPRYNAIVYRNSGPLVSTVCRHWFSSRADLFADAFECFFNFPMESIVCLVNILVLIKALTSRRLEFHNGAEFENGAREALSALSTLIRSRGTKIQSLTNSIGLSTCKEENLQAASVVMLSNVSKYGAPNSSIQQFMKFNAHMHNVHSILLHFFPLKANKCKHGSVCNCIVFWTVEEMTTNMLDRRMSGI